MAEILEGFLCPLCMKDLGDVNLLQLHFEENHSREDQAFVQSIKDLFGKAKKKILNEEDEAIAALGAGGSKLQLVKTRPENVHPVSGIRTDVYPGFTPPLVKQSHFAEFKKIRSCRVDRYATETNRLIVRLDRLLEGMPTDAAKRREHERAVVQWVEEQLVKLCPSCAKSFNLGRRKHHCRSCGSVMCADCSRFIEWDFCRRLINPSNISVYRPKEERLGWSVNGKADSRSVGSPSRPGFKLRRSNSKESMNSMMSLMDTKSVEEFRVCEYCRTLLCRREQAIEMQTVQPIISQFYAKLREYIDEGSALSVKYLQMADSLGQGETTYHLSDAKGLRLKLLKIAENVDLMSKRIAAIGTEAGDEAYLRSRHYLLQSQIRRAAVNFIKETLVGLPSLPTEEALLVLQENRRQEIARRVEEERRKAQEARLKFKLLQEKRNESMKSTPKLANSRSDQSIKYETGFVLSSSDGEYTHSSSEDPMLQQMVIIKSYISKARAAHRFDEVAMLEANLRDLQAEFKRSREAEEQAQMQQQQQEEQPRHQYESFYLASSDSWEQLATPAATGEALTSSPPAAPSCRLPAQQQPARSSFLPSPRALFSSLNPFGGVDSEDEYDASGKNPFAE